MAETYAIIDGGVVVNMVLAEEPLAPGWVLAAEGVGIGWLYDSGQFYAPPQVASEVPGSCTRRQGLLALLAAGHRRADIEERIADIADEVDREAALIEYESATWERANPFLQQMWSSLNGTPEQLDDLFRLAVTL